MMQDVTRIRSLTGSRRLLTWENEETKEAKWDNEDDYEIDTKTSDKELKLTPDTVIGDIIDEYPFIKEFMPTVSENYKRLLDPEQYAIMAKIATLEMVAIRGNLEVNDLIKIISDEIKTKTE